MESLKVYSDDESSSLCACILSVQMLSNKKINIKFSFYSTMNVSMYLTQQIIMVEKKVCILCECNNWDILFNARKK